MHLNCKNLSSFVCSKPRSGLASSRLKNGVSLVTVLLFMLVATIAATATYKLLTSGGLSSASRMKQQEARQSALAGIENTRMWMTFHANDVGALVKAFIEGGNKPINLDARVRQWQRSKQDYHVWLTGVNTEKSTYKLKILSSGVSQILGNTENDANVTVATWNESAIFNVDGLYQVKLLKEEVVEEVVASIPFKYNYFGGSTQSQGHIKAYSLLINGDLYGSNPAYTEDNLIVTGDVYITGNSVGAGNTACIGGDLYANNGVLGHDFYVGGSADHFSFPSTSEAAGLHNANVTGNVYIEGDLKASPTGDQKFQQNLTLNGTWSTNLSAHVAQVAGNLCLGKNGKVVISEKKPDPSRSFKVGGNVWAESTWPIWLNNGQKNEAEYDRIIIGNKPDSKVYIISAHKASDYVTLSENRTFVESKDYYRGTSGSAYGMGAAKWDNKTTRVYKELPPHLRTKDDAYYLYYYEGPGQDVDFIVSRTGGWGMGFGGTTYYASYYVGNQPFYTTTSSGVPNWPGYVPAGNHPLNMDGNTPIGSPYCKATPDKWRPECDVTPWFKSLGTVSRDTSGGRNFECADSVKAHCNKLWKKKKGCPHEVKSGNADYLVEDILVTAYDKFVSYANKGCTEVTQWGNRMSELLNQCYRDNSSNPQKAKQNLYNGYQVVKVADPGQIRDPKTPLKGKFIIIVTNKMGQQKLPPTTSDSYVFLYLTQGTKTTPKNPGNTHLYTLQPASDNGTYNYFIYTKYDIDGLMFNNSVFSGSIYAAVGNPDTKPSCAKAGDIKTRQMVFNEDLMNDLSANGVVCPSSVGTSCGGAVSSSSAAAEESSASADPSNGSGSTTSEYDSYYISMAPQLGVRLESQGKSKEPVPEPGEGNVTELAPSFIVLPRIIYVPNDPFGSLSDYYNIQPLNGSSVKKDNVTVTSCKGPGTASLHTTGKLYTSENLTQGLYTCTATAPNHPDPDVPFWVVVGGNETRDTKIISFALESQEMGTDDQKDVLLKVPPLAADLEVNVYCPDVDNGAWFYNLGPNVTRNGSLCTIKLSPSAEQTTPKLATVKTTNAVEGTLLFQLLAGEGYIPGSPSSTELYIKSIMHLNRMDVSLDDITEYCKTGSCPDGYADYWPDCDVSGEWVAPSMPAVNKIINNSWAVLISGTGNITLNSVGQNDCKVIIPQTTDNSIAVSSVQANMTYYLRASAKADVRQFTVGFSGDVGAGNNPVIEVSTEKRGTVKQCEYNAAKNHSDTCSVSIFKGEDVTVELKDDDNAKKFSFWRCSGSSCPTTETVTSKRYNSFTFSDDGTELIAVFGEADRHCFFDEIKRDSVGCDKIETEYCIDKCGNDATSKCSSADETGLFTNAKWHLISGILSQIITGPSGEIHIDKSVIKKRKQSAREPVVVMSTVNAGFAGTLKALINVPRATSSYDKSAINIMKSGFMLRANKYGNDYLMLNLYENGNGELEAQLTNGSTSLSYILTNGSGTARVSNSKMVMATIDLTTRDTLKVRANVGNFYGGAPTEYRGAFALSEFYSSLADAAHEYVGFSLADPNFKIYGIGWMSGTYNSECHDTYPTVKCSFAAVATDGVIKTKVDVVPWVGHSGWFDSKGCSPLYYYNGDDACLGGTCDVYNFAESGIGAHGYTVVNGETKTEVKTAKAWLGNCTNADEPEMAWGVSSEAERAHCGAFWTGKFEECKEHKPNLYSGSKPVNNGLEETVVFADKQNLRAATLHITLENTDNNEVEIWLVSESDNWGENDHESHSVKMTGNTGSFDVMQEFAAGSNGFDPENVKQIVFKNHGLTSATLTSIASTCANAIGITYCRADFDGDAWNVVTQVTNKKFVQGLLLSATIDGGSVWNVPKSVTGSDNDAIAWKDDLALVSIPDEGVYTHAGKSYVINAKITAPGQQEVSKQCSVSPDPIGTIGVSCSVVSSVASGAKFPTFNIDFNGCPGDGCPYKVYLDYGKPDQELIVEDGLQKTSARHSADKTEVCNNTDGCEHTYTVMKKTDLKPFTACSATFKVLRKEEEAPPDVECRISTEPNDFSTDPVFTGSQLYFVAYNKKAEDKTYNVTLKKGDDSIGTAILQSGSGRTMVASLGTLAKGTHSYSLYVGNEKRCDASVTVNDASGACTISGNRYEGHKLSMKVSGVTANTQFKWTLDNASRTIDCGRDGCWNNDMSAPATAGTYSYTVTKGANTICTGSVDIKPILTCSATPNPIGKGLPYTFTANAVVRCTNCSFTNDAGSTENNIVVLAGGSWTKNRTPNSLGTKSLTLSCTNCSTDRGDVSVSCSVPLEVVKIKPTFSCADNLKATVNKDNNVRIRLEDITSCDDDDKCTYSISGTGSDATVYTGCTNTNCTIPAITNKSKNKGDTAIYSVTLTNKAGHTTEDCSVDFVEGPTITCNCVSVCGEGCQTKIKTSSLNNVAFTGCMFFKDISTLQFNNYTINGTPKTGQFCWDNATDCATKLSSIEKIDGGYYVKVVDQTGYLIVGTEAADPCEGSGADDPVTGPVIITISEKSPYYTPDQQQEYENGTCFSLVGTWDKCCDHPTPRLDCQNVSGNGMTYSYNGNPTYKTTQNGNMSEDFGVTLQQTTTTTTFISNVCVTSHSGSKIKCKFRN